MPIVSLLREWSEREPDRCSYVGGIFAIRGWTLTHEEEVSERLVNSEIQCAVQEAIEAKEWNWYLGRVTIDEGIYYKSKIALPPSENKHKLNIFLSTHSPTHVLLQAYLQALATINAVNKDVESVRVEDDKAENNQEAGASDLKREKTTEEATLIEKPQLDVVDVPAAPEDELLQVA